MLHRSSRKRGFVFVLTAISMVVLLAFLGLAIDVGYLQFVKTRMQTAVDAATLGGVQQIRLGGTSAQVVAAAKGDAARNGFTDGVGGVTITVNNPPATGFYTTDPTGVEVVISQTVSNFFMKIIGSPSSTVRARAVARQGSSTACIYTLDPTAYAALSASGGASVQVGCGIVVNSNHVSAMTASGGGSVTARAVQIVGGYALSGGGSITPIPLTGVPPANDPLATLAAPTVGGCTFNNVRLNAVTRTLDPGVYCDGIRIGGGSVVTFNPGTYILMGGGLRVTGGATLTGAGVTFYNTAGGSYSYDGISVSSGATLNLSAPISGPFGGILFFQDHSIIGGADSNFAGVSSSVLQGTLYFPTTALAYSGGSSTTAYTIIVARTIAFSGGTTLNNDYSTLVGGSPVKGTASLSE